VIWEGNYKPDIISIGADVEFLEIFIENNLVRFIRINYGFIGIALVAWPDRGFDRSDGVQSEGAALWIGRLNLPLR